MSAVTDILTTDQIHELWGAGFTIMPRARGGDPFNFDTKIVPHERSYQWMHLQHDQLWIGSGWAAVPYSRHEGVFGPYGTPGDVEISGLGLFEKPKFEVDKERAENVTKAQNLVEDWAQKAGDMGFTGGARVVTMNETEAMATKIDTKKGISTHVEMIERPKEKVIELVSEVPKDMFWHMGVIFAERDRLKDEIVQPDRSLKPGPVADKFYAAIDADKSLPWWPTLHAILLPIAIENVRKALKEKPTQESAS